MSVPNRPAFDEAAIYVRRHGRQLAISTGEVDTGDRGEDESMASGEGEVEHQTPEGTRQTITGFTDRSRRNLRDTIHALRRDAESLFLTLTYHEQDPGPRDAKNDLDTFCKRLIRQFPEAAIVWKMEPQNRGAVHFHLMVYGVPFIPAQKVSKVWHDCTDETSDAHEVAGVDVEKTVHEQDDKLAGYLAKYMDKTFSTNWENPGRFWGVRNRSALPLADWEKVCRIDADEASQIIYDLLRRWGVDLPEYTSIPSMTVNTRGDPAEYISTLP